MNKAAVAAVSLLVAGLMTPAMGQQVSQAVAPGAAVPGTVATTPAAQNVSLAAPKTLTQDIARTFIDDLGSARWARFALAALPPSSARPSSA